MDGRGSSRILPRRQTDKEIRRGKEPNRSCQELKKIRRDFDDGLLIRDTNVTLIELFERWFEDIMRNQIAPSTFSNYQTVVRMHVLPGLGKKKLVELTVSDVDKLLSLKTDSGLSPSTVRRIRAVLAQCLDQAIRWELVHRNVATLSRSPKMNRREGRTLTPEQARHLLETLQGHQNEALYALMLSTGLRRGEALGLQWRDFDRTTEFSGSRDSSNEKDLDSSRRTRRPH